LIGQPRILTVTDVQRGILALAAFLGVSASDLISANNLSPPYLTLDASEVYGPPLADTSLSASLSVGADTISIANQPLSINEIYLSYAGTSGLVAENVAVSSYDGQTITLSTPTKNAYPQGSRLQLYASYVLNNTVLLPGDTIFVPLTTTNVSLNISNQQQLVDTFGSDIADPITFTNGDITTVSGMNTLIQRIRVALQTSIGSLPLYPDLGNRLRQTVGTPAQGVKWQAVVSDCLTRLPEVDGVSSVQVTVQGTTVSLSCLVTVSTSDAPIQLINESFTLTAA